METMQQIVLQEMNEKRFSRKHIDSKIREEIAANPDIQTKLIEGERLVNEYMAGSYYDSKNIRIAQLQGMDIPELVFDIFVGVSYCLRDELFTSVSSQMAARLKFSDRKDAIATVAELLAVLCATDVYDINKNGKMGSLTVKSNMPLSDTLIKFIDESIYLPPMVCEPLELESNYSSGYLTHRDSLILGSGNHHDGDLCLDVLNTMNKVKLKLDTEFLSSLEEDSSELTVENLISKAAEKGSYLSTADAKARLLVALENWDTFKKQGYQLYTLLTQQGNELHLTHKVDKRGRIYAQGYHVTTQGTPFKKAMLEFANEELVTGI